MPRQSPASEFPGGHAALLEAVRKAPALHEICDGDIDILLSGNILTYEAGEKLFSAGDSITEFLVMLSGTLSIQRDYNPEVCALPTLYQNETVGETMLLSGKASVVSARAETTLSLLAVKEEGFWKLMSHCVPMRRSVIGRLASRVLDFQSVVMEREKMVSIGTLTAGLMHELNNPGTAAMRATSELRKKLNNLQELSLRLSAQADTAEEQQCIHQLLLDILKPCAKCDISTLEASDRAEQLSEWLDQAGIDDAWHLGPALSDVGIEKGQLACAHDTLEGQKFSDALHWLEALGSSMSLLQTVETSMQRITDLISAVKTYSSGASGMQEVNVHDTIKAGFMMVLHKIRQRGIAIDKQYDEHLPKVRLFAPAVTQVWTNLLDNAADAVPEPGGEIKLRTRTDAGNVVVEIEDNGVGIPEEVLPHIFDAFYTTKESGKGTGLGLDIVMRNVKRAGGVLTVESRPGKTVFRVTLPTGAPLPLSAANARESSQEAAQPVPVH